MVYKIRSYARSKTQIENETRRFSIWIFRSGKKSYLILRKATIFFSDRKIQIEKRRFSKLCFRSRMRSGLKLRKFILFFVVVVFTLKTVPISAQSVPSNIRTGPTDANAFRGHRLTTQKGYILRKIEEK